MIAVFGDDSEYDSSSKTESYSSHVQMFMTML
jgi:hypothetical protein